jgi:hypothetical protein
MLGKSRFLQAGQWAQADHKRAKNRSLLGLPGGLMARKSLVEKQRFPRSDGNAHGQ